MKGSELQEARARAGVSVDELAAMMDVPPAQVLAWERGGRVPREQARLASFALHGLAAGKLLEASGLPECAWVKARPDPPDVHDPAFDAYAREYLAHDRACPVCQAREAFVREHVGAPPGLGGGIGSLMARADGLSEPWRSVAGGAGAALLLNGIGIVIGLGAGAVSGHLEAVWIALAVLVVSVAGGGAAGLVHLATRRLRDAGWLGYYASYVAATTTYIGALMTSLSWAASRGLFKDDASDFAGLYREPEGWIIVAGMGLVFGVTVGASLRAKTVVTPAKSVPAWRRWFWGLLLVASIALAVLNGHRAGAPEGGRPADRGDDSLAALRAAVDSHPADVGARMRLGNAYLQRYDLDAADAEFAGVLRVDPRSGAAYTGLAIVRMDRRRPVEALRAVDSARALGDTTTFLPLLRADALRGLGRCREAVVELGPFLAAHPDWLPARLTMSRCDRALGRNAEALAVIREAVRRQPESPPLRGELVEALVAVGSVDSALAEVRWQVQRWPRDGFSWLALGKVAYLANRQVEARRGFDRAFVLRPGLRDSLGSTERLIWQELTRADAVPH
jgi:Flp pilus assembly protein TadD